MSRLPVETAGRPEQLLVLLRLYPRPEAPASRDASFVREPMLPRARMRASLLAQLPSRALSALSGHDLACVLLRQGDDLVQVLEP